MKKLMAKEMFEYLIDFDPDLQMEGEEHTEVAGVSSIYHYKEGTLTWIKEPDKASLVKEPVTAIVCMPGAVMDARVKFIANNPKDIFFRAADYLADLETVPIVAETAVFGCQIKMGTGVSIGSGAYIGNHVSIGDQTVIEENVVIGDGVIIGDNCHIKAGAVIGGRGFGYSKKDGQYRPVRHFGSVVIGNNVDVGSNVCIDRGTLDDTVIHDGVKIDNMCHIGHNVVIGEDTIITAGNTICGSVHIGKNVYIAPHSVIMNQLKVEDGAMIGMGAVVMKNVNAATVNIGCPAKAVRIRREDEWVKY